MNNRAWPNKTRSDNAAIVVFFLSIFVGIVYTLLELWALNLVTASIAGTAIVWGIIVYVRDLLPSKQT